MAILNRWFKLWWVTFLNPTLRGELNAHADIHLRMTNTDPPFYPFLTIAIANKYHRSLIGPPPRAFPMFDFPMSFLKYFETKLKLSIPCHACCFGERTAPPSNCPCDRLHEALRCHCLGSEPPKKLEANHAGTPKEHKISQVLRAL